MEEVKRDGEYGEYSVISYNEEGKPTQPFFADTTEMIKGCTSSGAEIAKKAGDTPPHRTRYSHPDYEDVRRPHVVEKCIFCEHRVKKGELPYCVVACPATARIFGDLEDPKSEVAQLLKSHKHVVRKPEEGTSPNVYYIREYGVR
jgi:Fe-S-cluster-containing dehydrogenase component